MAGLFMAGCATTRSALPEELIHIGQLQESGRFDEADERTRQLLAKPGVTPAEETALRFELERSRRIRMDYRLTRDRLWSIVEEGVADVTPEEFDGWVAKGLFDYKLIDGEERFVGPSLGNLFYRNPELNDRRIRNSGGSWAPFLLNHTRDIIQQTAAQAQDTGEPLHFRITYTNTVKPGVVPKGELIRCWMVYPQQFAAQDGVVLEASTPEPVWLNGPTYPQRSLYLEQPSLGDEPTVFRAVYTVTTRSRHIAIDPARVAAVDQSGPEVEWFLREQEPHVVYTPELQALLPTIIGDEKNPAVKARLIYDWVSSNVQYSYAREYSTLRNISLYCYTNKYGDCGQIALLYITLCRMAGIPARWQSGWVIYPMDQNLHDWCEIWLQPHGWVPVDPNYGVFFATPTFSRISSEEHTEVKDFYFGGMDGYRLVINRDHGFPHYPPKTDFRSDTVDFQRGELEAGGRNLYFNEFEYDLEVEFLTSPGGEPEPDAEGVAKTITGPREPGLPR